MRVLAAHQGLDSLTLQAVQNGQCARTNYSSCVCIICNTVARSKRPKAILYSLKFLYCLSLVLFV